LSENIAPATFAVMFTTCMYVPRWVYFGIGRAVPIVLPGKPPELDLGAGQA